MNGSCASARSRRGTSRGLRNERELEATREYIVHNPLHWELDRDNPAHIDCTR